MTKLINFAGDPVEAAPALYCVVTRTKRTGEKADHVHSIVRTIDKFEAKLISSEVRKQGYAELHVSGSSDYFTFYPLAEVDLRS